MDKLKCLIVDDEPLAADILEKYIGQLDNLQLSGKCANALDALIYLQTNKVDLLFLDIQMPKLSGLDFLKTLNKRPKVILTTAFRDYAVEGFELNVLDYLVKPIPFERFLIAVNKYHGEEPSIPSLISSPVQAISKDAFLYLKSDKKMVKVFLREILYIESLKDYVRVKTVHKEIITHQRITYLEEKLPDEKFLRIHRSFIISLDHIRSFNSSSIEIDHFELPIGRQYKTEVLKVLSYG
ncbi:LytR/AlgR family response regulator transcription factor [Pedobacter nutrimenti]|jgi:DNA-binding LytR/AlgR family response regulator|uniref:LytTR family two component transcriptional regulator n=1 Tax=Pedobacter nutrimenti TaxID=1241337 RepID=A0A318U6D3_9SPHI|nr:LytTR family DNA-binding domain-containing protein [Pedobacter nutrimenti]PYF68410.1 LytTR family two component transcriptional regulator [Pedobacter nutrimenti]